MLGFLYNNKSYEQCYYLKKNINLKFKNLRKYILSIFKERTTMFLKN